VWVCGGQEQFALLSARHQTVEAGKYRDGPVVRTEFPPGAISQSRRPRISPAITVPSCRTTMPPPWGCPVAVPTVVAIRMTNETDRNDFSNQAVVVLERVFKLVFCKN
jgi:hypothetical protein